MLDRVAALVAFLLLLHSAVAGGADPDPFSANAPRMPLAWKAAAPVEVPADQTAVIAERLGANIERITSTRIDAGGIVVVVNLVHCATEDQAKELARKLVEQHGSDPLYAVRRGADVAEFVCANRAVAAKTRDVLGWEDPGQTTWKVSMEVVPLTKSDDAKWNRLYNLLSASKADPARADAVALAEAAKSFEFGDTLELHSGPGVEYAFSPPDEAADRERLAGRTRFHLRKPEEDHGIPFVKVVARIPALSFSPSPAEEKPDRHALVAPTTAWPVADTDIRSIVAQCLEGAEPDSPRRRAERILAAVNKRVQFGGEIVGSRYGVKQTLAQGRGHCWDKSDVFICFCRAAGIPARQVGGWVLGLEGHVWSQVLLEGEGWLDVDATTTWVGVSADYVPLWMSEDGRIPILYRGAPLIEHADK